MEGNSFSKNVLFTLKHIYNLYTCFIRKYKCMYLCSLSLSLSLPLPFLFSKLQERGVLDQYLARALGLPTEEGNRLSAIDEAQYVLTLDYTIKMLNIHERYECGIPVIIKGETGVGKTALVDMLSKLWSNALLYQWNKEKGIIFDNIRELLGN